MSAPDYVRETADRLRKLGLKVALSRKYDLLLVIDKKPVVVVATKCNFRQHWEVTWVTVPVGPVWLYKEVPVEAVVALSASKEACLVYPGTRIAYFQSLTHRGGDSPDSYAAPTALGVCVRFDRTPPDATGLTTKNCFPLRRELLREEMRYLDDKKRGIVQTSETADLLIRTLSPPCSPLLPASASP